MLPVAKLLILIINSSAFCKFLYAIQLSGHSLLVANYKGQVYEY